jgi:5-methylcytosine-specific restriction endonuclease McrA
MRREEFPAKVKAEAAIRANGHCEKCTAKLMAGHIEFDHAIPLAIGGTSDIGNCICVCTNCHKEKTAKIDAPRIAKTRRMGRKHLGIKKRSRFACARSGPFKQKIGGGVVRRVPAG